MLKANAFASKETIVDDGKLITAKQFYRKDRVSVVLPLSFLFLAGSSFLTHITNTPLAVSPFRDTVTIQ